MRTTNPILTRLGAEAERERAAASHYYGQQVPGQPAPYPVGYGEAGAPPSVRPMTVDDVVVRTIGLLALTAAAAAGVWVLTPPEAALALTFPAAIIGLVLGLVISFARITNPLLLGAYAVVEGVFVGGFSLAIVLWTGKPAIVMQAVIATLGVFLLMAFLYKSGKIRATPKFQRGLMGAMLGAAAVMLVNLVITLFTGEPTILRDGGPIAILVSLVFIVIAALSFILSFHEVEEGVRLGLPQKYAWTCAFGILVSVVWLYLEVLRLLSYFNE